MFKQKRALITGASSGLGKAFAQQLAREGCNLVLVARREALLQTLKQELETQYSVTVDIDAVDLIDSQACHRLVADYADQIDLLINNAGKGMWGSLLDNSAEECERILQLNTVALTILSHGFGQAMAKRGKGHILQVASIGCFVVAPKSSVYHSSKAYVANFGESLAQELAPHGVVSTVVCPGMTQSEFYTSSNHALNTKGKQSLASAEGVVSGALKALKRGQRLYVPGLQNKFEAFFLSKMPRSWIAYFYNRRMKTASAAEAFNSPSK